MLGTHTKTVLASLIIGFYAASGVMADVVSIPIKNHSFESPVVNPNQWLQPPTDWTLVGNYFGVFRASGEFGQAAAPTDGSQIAFFNVSSADGRQNLATAYQAATDYVLSIDIAARDPYDASRDMDLILYAGGDSGNRRVAGSRIQ